MARLDETTQPPVAESCCDCCDCTDCEELIEDDAEADRAAGFERCGMCQEPVFGWRRQRHGERCLCERCGAPR